MKNITVFTWMGIGIFALIIIAGIVTFLQKPKNVDMQYAQVVAPIEIGSGAPSSSQMKKFTTEGEKISFEFPSSWTNSVFGSVYDESGKTILIQDAEGKRGLQILITQFDEDITLTAERIHHDVPDMQMSDVRTRTLANNGSSVSAVVFTSTNSALGKSHEAWFVFEKRLYQISAPDDAVDVFNVALESMEL